LTFALPTELLPHKLEGKVGFEPTTQSLFCYFAELFLNFWLRG